MKKGILTLLFVLALAVPVLGQRVGVDYSERCRWFGFPLFGRDYMHNSATAEIRDFDFSVASHVSQANDLDTWDTRIGYRLPIGGDAVDLRAGAGYLILPGGNEITEMSATMALPGAISPRYTLTHIEQGIARNGQIHVIGVDICLGSTDPNEISANIMAEVTFNDGVNPFGDKVIRGFTHTSAGFSINVPAGDIILQPGIFWQHTFDDLVNPDQDEVWYGIGVEYRF